MASGRATLPIYAFMLTTLCGGTAITGCSAATDTGIQKITQPTATEATTAQENHNTHLPAFQQRTAADCTTINEQPCATRITRVSSTQATVQLTCLSTPNTLYLRKQDPSQDPFAALTLADWNSKAVTPEPTPGANAFTATLNQFHHLPLQRKDFNSPTDSPQDQLEHWEVVPTELVGLLLGTPSWMTRSFAKESFLFHEISRIELTATDYANEKMEALDRKLQNFPELDSVALFILGTDNTPLHTFHAQVTRLRPEQNTTVINIERRKTTHKFGSRPTIRANVAYAHFAIVQALPHEHYTWVLAKPSKAICAYPM